MAILAVNRYNCRSLIASATRRVRQFSYSNANCLSLSLSLPLAGMEFLETSAKNATNVEKAFMTMAGQIKQRMANQPMASVAATPLLSAHHPMAHCTDAFRATLHFKHQPSLAGWCGRRRRRAQARLLANGRTQTLVTFGGH